MATSPVGFGPLEERLHAASDPTGIKKILRGEGQDDIDVNAQDHNGDTYLHVLVRRIVSPSGHKMKDKHRKIALECLWTFLVYCDSTRFDINTISNRDGNTALHISVSGKNLDCVKVLLVFGANVNSLNAKGQTPTDIAVAPECDAAEIVEFLQIRGGYIGEFGKQRSLDITRLPKGPSNDPPESIPVRLTDLTDGEWKDLKITMPSKEDESMAIAAAIAHSGSTPLEFSVRDGQRILSLDGGGLKGLIMIEILIRIEQLTQRKITDLFDWIVGTSTGGVIALGLVYAKKSLHQLKQLYFEMKEDVFGSGNKYGYDFDTKKMEEVLRRYLTPEMKMTSVLEPKVLVAAVDCQDTNMKICFFNNCFFDEFSGEFVWKVARYTSSAPVYFEPGESGEHRFVDGGVKANNPTDYAFTRIQKYLDEQLGALGQQPHQSPQYACVVSVGCGVYPPDPIGDFNIQKFMTLNKDSVLFLKARRVLLNLLRLLGNAISNEEEVAENCRLRCEKQGIPFYRFSPAFDAESDVKILPTETDVNKLSDLVLRAQAYIESAWESKMDILVQLLNSIYLVRSYGSSKFTFNDQ